MTSCTPLTNRNPDNRPRDAGELLTLLGKAGRELDVPVVAVAPPEVRKPHRQGSRSVRIQSEPAATRRAHIGPPDSPATARVTDPARWPQFVGRWHLFTHQQSPPVTRTRGRLIATLMLITTLGSAALVAGIAYAQNQSTQSASQVVQQPTDTKSSMPTTPTVTSTAAPTQPPTTVKETVTATVAPTTSVPRSRSTTPSTQDRQPH